MKQDLPTEVFDATVLVCFLVYMIFLAVNPMVDKKGVSGFDSERMTLGPKQRN